MSELCLFHWSGAWNFGHRSFTIEFLFFQTRDVGKREERKGAEKRGSNASKSSVFLSVTER